MANVEELLRQRYGQARFNPAAGQTQMTFQEWMDRHPALRGRGGDKNFAMYQGFTNAANGAAYDGPQNVSVPDYSETLADAANRYKASGGMGGWRAQPPGMGQAAQAQPPVNPDPSDPQNPTDPAVVGSMGAPDAPATTPVGGNYQQFVQSHGGKSTAGLAATWRNANGMKLNRKMASTAAGRRIQRDNKGAQ